jgi:magnesium chelatase family protein
MAVTLCGLEPHLIQVEVDSGRGLPCFNIVGLPETSVRESRVRVRAALRQLDVDLNEFVITVNLAPAYLRKTGSAFDLAIAIGALAALQRVRRDRLGDTVLLGELSLAGELRPVRGALPALLGAKAKGIEEAIVPRDNAAETSLIEGLTVRAANRLEDVIAHLNGQAILSKTPPPSMAPAATPQLVDLADVRGQYSARRAIEIAAAGAHHMLMVGPPGAGKTMLAHRVPTVLPPMTPSECLDVSAVHSVAGLLDSGRGLLQERPFRAPHHTISTAALLGGGQPVRPGEISLAHHGCLFLDELLEFQRHAIESLREPLDSGQVTICRARSRATFPARPMIVAAVNPCPCGYAGEPMRCRCSPERVRSYRSRLSGPLIDRLDLHVILPGIRISEMYAGKRSESSATVRARVVQARAMQQERKKRGDTQASFNAMLGADDLERVAKPDANGRALLNRAAESLGLSMRSYQKLRRVARTIADIEGSERVASTHFAEAIQFRCLDRDDSRGAS